MCYLDDFSYKRIGEVLGISETAVGARLTRTRAKLQACAATVAWSYFSGRAYVVRMFRGSRTELEQCVRELENGA